MCVCVCADIFCVCVYTTNGQDYCYNTSMRMKLMVVLASNLIVLIHLIVTNWSGYQFGGLPKPDFIVYMVPHSERL